jgi:hypothetical protein
MHCQKPAPFIPPEPLLFAQFTLLVSWIALFVAAGQGGFGASPSGLVWIHAVVLGWLTTTSLAFMIHVVPGFTDVEWRYERLARASLWLFQPGVIVLLAGFWLWKPSAIAIGGSIVTAGLIAFVIPLAATIAVALRSDDRVARVVARAFIIVTSALLVTGILGLVMAFGLANGQPGTLRLAPIHGTIGVVGWICLLVAGVSSRTFNRLIGRADRRVPHIATSTLGLCGYLLWVAGTIADRDALIVAGAVALVASAFFFAGSTLWSLRYATAKHRLPQEFVGASAIWLVVAALLGAANFAGFEMSGPMLFALLIGWVGQTVNGHLMHTGVRLLATMVISDDDETQPVALLDRRAGVASFYLNQICVACGVVGLAIASSTLVQAAAIAGICSMIAMFVNMLHARAAANTLRREAALS